MRILSIILPILLLACDNSESIENSDIVTEDNLHTYNEDPLCPEGHKDSILNIIYGLPTAETFAKADSGLVALGGCELSDETHYCTIHEISF